MYAPESKKYGTPGGLTKASRRQRPDLISIRHGKYLVPAEIAFMLHFSLILPTFLIELDCKSPGLSVGVRRIRSKSVDDATP